MTSQQVDNNTDSGGDIPPVSIKPTKSEAQATQFSSWYHSFRNLDISTITTNTIVNEYVKMLQLKV